MKYKKYVLCIYNKNNKASLELRKLYERIPDKDAEKRGLIRVIDESEEDYLYPAKNFASIRLPLETRRKLD